MNLWQLSAKSLLFHWRVNGAIALGVAAATAVLTGALIVGDSMRGSLRDLTLERLGRVDSIVIAEGFFAESLAARLASSTAFQSDYTDAVPILFFPDGSSWRDEDAAAGQPRRSVGQVNLLGIRSGFWELGIRDEGSLPTPDVGQVVINEVLARDLGISAEAVQTKTARLSIGVPKRQLLPADSALGSKTDLVERIVNLQVIAITPAEGLGRFGLHPSQVPPRNAWLAMDDIQSALRDGLLKHKPSLEQANMLLVARQASLAGTATASSDRLEQALGDSLTDLADVGLSLKRVTQRFDDGVESGDNGNDATVFDYWSLSSDRLVIPDKVATSIRATFPDAEGLSVYLANDLAPATADSDGAPFSIVAAYDPAKSLVLPTVAGGTIDTLADDEIAITEWLADDQQLKIGDRLRMRYFEPETTHGNESEQTAQFTVSAIVPLTRPETPFRVPRRGDPTPPTFSLRPTTANDPDVTPVVPGLTDAESIERWELPFATAGRIRAQDEDYWDFFRTTPKAWISFSAGKALWASRFGYVTSFRIAPDAGDRQRITDQLLKRFLDDGHLGGLEVVAIKRNGLQASSGSTPFDALFLGLSLFVIGSALILVSLLFRLALQKRSDELGVLLATGFSQRSVTRVWLRETLFVAAIGAVAGALIGIGYAALMLYGLSTWWLGAIAVPFLALHINWWTIPLGIVLGMGVSALTTWLSIRSARRRSVRMLLAGNIDMPEVAELDSGSDKSRKRNRRRGLLVPVAVICLVVAAGLTVYSAVALAGESQAGGFMSAGFLVLAAALALVWKQLALRGTNSGSTIDSIGQLAGTAAARNPMRSTLTIGLVAVAAFLILAISAFRLSPAESGTAGFNYVATTSQPVFADLNTESGRAEVLPPRDLPLNDSSRVLAFRFKDGQDASCNNLYQSTQPRVLGVTPATIAYFDDPDVTQFEFAAGTDDANPWRALEAGGTTEDGVVPVIIDKNTAWYSLKVYLPGTEFTVEYDTGETVTFRLVGLLSNTVLQGSLLVSEANFERAFPDVSGYRYFLMRLAGENAADPEIARFSNALSDFGFDWQSATTMLAGFLAVQNAYLSTFQSLGFLGLLLGTFGLAAVQLRSILERRRELGLMRAVGFSRRQLSRMIALENARLLLLGLAVGVGAALVTTLPHWWLGNASVPWRDLALMFVFILMAGLVTSAIAARSVFRAPLVQSLRDG